jgi:hypothetical protein
VRYDLTRLPHRAAALALLGALAAPLKGETMLTLDDRSTGDLRTASGSSWRLVTDGVMGGVSRGRLEVDRIEGRPCLCLRGDVSLDNNGGFIQAALDLRSQGPFDASGYGGIALEVYGNGEHYNVHLRTPDLRLPWQSYRAVFEAPPQWRVVELPFKTFTPHRTDVPLDLQRLLRVGVVAIGRAFEADLCLGKLALYRNP